MMSRVLLVIIAILCLTPSFTAAQTDGRVSETYREAEAALLSHDYKKAIRLFQRCLKTHPELAAAHRGMGLSYQLLNDHQSAAQCFDRVIELDSTFSRVVYFEAAEAHYRSGNPDRALSLFQRFDSLQAATFDQTPTELEAEPKYLERLSANIQACRISLDSTKFQGINQILNLGPAINTKSDEYFPCLSNDQSLMYYTRRRSNAADEDLYYSRSSDSVWATGLPLGSFNTNHNEGMSTLVRNGRTMFFTACAREGVLGTCDIWEAEVENLQIKGVGALGGYANSERWESQAAISCDGSTLYFASNREGGLGGTDLWYTKRQPDGRWSNPINLGPKINTPMDEESPFITNDGKTLYFASTGHPGMGEQDIFFSWIDDREQWSDPINLGPPVNTAFRELGFFLSADGQSGYFASDRPGGQGGMDIYKFQLSEQLFSDPITFVEGQVRDSILGNPIVTEVKVENRGNFRTDKDGRFFLCVPAGQELNILIEQENFLPYRIRLNVPEWDNRRPYPLNILLSHLRNFVARNATPVSQAEETVHKKVETEHSCIIFFGFDSQKLEIKEINRLDDFMKKLDGREINRVEIVGYADDVGADDYNLKLSEERAKNIALFMREYGIIVHKVYLEGRGEIKDGNPKSKNRRVEVRIVTLE